MKRDTTHWLGIDVSKSKLDVALLDERGKFKNRVFPNDTKGHTALVNWLIERTAAGLVHVCLEATGSYGDLVATTLVERNLLISVVNPARVKGFAQSELTRNKTDRADAELLARFCQALAPEAWLPAAPEVRELRALVERLGSLKEMQQQEINRLEAAINQPGMRASIDSHLEWLKRSIEQLERQINDHIDGHPSLREDAELITSIPGLGKTTAAKLLAYLGDARRFKNGKALAAFIGVVPRLRISGSSVRAEA